MNRAWLWVFGALTALNLVAEGLSLPLGVYLSKPLLMPVLGAAFYFGVRAPLRGLYWMVLLALFFSFLGDTFLMLPEQQEGGPLFFMLGLGSFLIAHICYIVGFVRYSPSGWAYLKAHPWYALPFLLIFVGMLAFLWQSLPPELQGPVVVYSFTIAVMGASAVTLFGKAGQGAAITVLCGAVLFMLSDSLIAVNKFRPDVALWQPRLLIMSTYLAAQYLIVSGVCRVLRDPRSAASTPVPSRSTDSQ